MKRVVNARYFLFALMFLVSGLLCAYQYLHGQNYIFLFLAAICLFIIVCIIIRKTKVVLIILLMCLVFGMGYFSFAREYNLAQEESFIGLQVKLTGIISDESNLREVGYELTLKNCSVYANNTKHALNGKVKYFSFIPSFNEKFFEVGDKVVFLCVLDKVNIFRDGIDSFVYKNKIFWTITKLNEISDHTRLSPSFIETFRISIRESLLNIMPEDEAGTAQALILGDKGFMSTSAKEYFRKSGVAHIFAVSGLHISFVIVIINSLLCFLKMNKKFSLVITMIVILFYAYLCGFPSSVVRAGIMAFCILLGNLSGRPKDMITSISVAAIIILLFRPLDIFDAGFLMSFGAVYGICCITNLFNKFKCFKNNKFLQPIVVTIGATIGTFPFVVNFYGTFSLIGVLLNLIVIPIISIVFVLIWIGCIPFLNFVLVLPSYILTFLTNSAKWISKSPLSNIPINSFGVGTIIFLIILFCIGGYIILGKRSKLILVSILSITFAVSCYFTTLPKTMLDQCNFYEKGNIVAMSKNDLIIYSDFNDYNDIKDINILCKNYSIKTISIIVSGNTEALKLYNIDKKLKHLEVEVVRLYMLSVNDNKIGLIKKEYNVIVVPPNEFVTLSGISFRSITDGQKLLGGHIIINGRNTILFDTLTKAEFLFVTDYLYFSVDIIKSNSFIDELSYMFNSSIVVTDKSSKLSNVISSKLYGNFTLVIKNDIITIKDM